MTLIDLYLEYVKPMLGSINYHRFSILCGVSAALERRVWLNKERLGLLYPNIYVLLVGAPGNGKTFHAEQTVQFVNVLAQQEKKLSICAERITSASLIKTLKEAERKYLIDTRTNFQSPIFLFSPELSRTIEDFGGGTLTSDLTDFYDSCAINGIRRKRTETTGLISIANPNIVFLGCTTEETLTQAAAQNLITSGLSSRIIFVVEPHTLDQQYEQVSEDPALKKAITEEFINLYRLKGPLSVDEQAHKCWIDIAKKSQKATENAINPLMKHYFSRKRWQIYKIAMLLCAVNHRRKVCLSDVEIALQWIEQIEPNISKGFLARDISSNPTLMFDLESIIPTEPDFISKSDLLMLLYKQGLALPLNYKSEGVIRSLRESKMIETKLVNGDELFTKRKM